MAWNDRAVTMQGLTMLRRCLGGETLTLDYAAGGAGTVPAASLMMQTDVADRKQTFAFGGPLAEIENGKRVNILISSVGVEQGYALRQVGIWAHIGQEEPALFALIQDNEGTPVYSQAEFPDFVMNFYTVLAIGGGADIAVTVDPAAMASMEALQAAMKSLAPILGNAPPQSATTGNPGQHYLDQTAGKEYVCLGADESGYQWRLAGADQAGEIAYGKATVEIALDAFVESQALQNEAIAQAHRELEAARQALALAAQRLETAEQTIAGHTTAIQDHTGNAAIHVTQAEKDGWNAKAATGPQGPAGPQGPKGDTGATGPQGPAGPAPDISKFVLKAGDTITGNLRLKGSGNYGNVLNFGDGDYVHISEPTDDNMEIKAKNVTFSTTNPIHGVPTPSASTDAANKDYVDKIVSISTGTWSLKSSEIPKRVELSYNTNKNFYKIVMSKTPFLAIYVAPVTVWLAPPLSAGTYKLEFDFSNIYKDLSENRTMISFGGNHLYSINSESSQYGYAELFMAFPYNTKTHTALFNLNKSASFDGGSAYSSIPITFVIFDKT